MVQEYGAAGLDDQGQIPEDIEIQAKSQGLFVTDRPSTANHSGAVGGFFAYMLLIPDEDLGVGFAINSDDDDAFGQMLSLTANRFVE